MTTPPSAAKELVDGASASISSAALTSPFWLPALKNTSEIAALLTPILGGAWLIVQIIQKIKEIRKK
ncbi:hypothetical protein LO749_20800 [Paracoccus denitrificans]|uniref:hypothetical protein n=1 Tax=Paracoccus denitrificans TaxID=266 RepID=UPI001E528F5B|nr:hypothetical protein [Paracoccus denitrificans]UFS67872.1 hypothetical protein LO749_20800 [Paracoccus denitrificans]